VSAFKLLATTFGAVEAELLTGQMSFLLPNQSTEGRKEEIGTTEMTYLNCYGMTLLNPLKIN